MTKAPVKFQKNRYKTVGGVVSKGTYFYRGTDGRTGGRKERQRDKN